MSLSLHIFSIIPPDENPTIFESDFCTSLRTVDISDVLPDTLVATTSVFESTVFGSRYPLTIVT